MIDGKEPYALVHTAALLRRRASLDEVTEDDWDSQVDTNLKATFFLCRSFGNEMKRVGEGRALVLFNSSQSWMTGGFGGATVYATTKGGVVSMSRGLARSYGRDGVTVNAIAPGQINTPMLLTGLDPAIYEKMREETPSGLCGGAPRRRRYGGFSRECSRALYLGSDDQRQRRILDVLTHGRGPTSDVLMCNAL